MMEERQFIYQRKRNAVMEIRMNGVWALVLAVLAVPAWAQQRDMTVPPAEYFMAFGPY